MTSVTQPSELEALREENQRLRAALESRENAARLTELTARVADLEHQLRLFDTALSWIADYVFVCDLQARIVYANRARLGLWGRPLEEVLGKNFFELNYPPKLAERIEGQIRTVIETGEPLRAEAEYTGASGISGYYDYILVPVFGTDGRVECVAGSTRNITERREMELRLEASEAQSREILESITDAFFALDKEWRFTYLNGQAERVLNWAHGEVLGKVIWDVYPGLRGSEFERVYRRAADDGLASSITEYYPDHKRWYEVHVYPAHHGITIYFRNVTDEVDARAERDKHIRDIEGLNTRLTRAMKETHHRVKNNLQVIAAMIDMQVLEHSGKTSIPVNEFLRLKVHVHTLSTVHDLLTHDVKEDEAMQRVSAREALEQLLPLLQKAAWNQTVTYSVSDGLLTPKQCVGLCLVLNELVSNALKHGKDGASVSFDSSGTEAILTVRDTGRGFPADFEPARAANMGLLLVENLVSSDLGGTVTFSNDAGGLVTVTFPLPQ